LVRDILWTWLLGGGRLQAVVVTSGGASRLRKEREGAVAVRGAMRGVSCPFIAAEMR
jgi:hypothetical protein